MLSELCHELNNWFCRKKFFGTIVISDGEIDIDNCDIRDEDGHPLSYYAEKGLPILQQGQYYRIVGSVFNDGVYKNESDAIEPTMVDIGGGGDVEIPPINPELPGGHLTKGAATDSEGELTDETFEGAIWAMAVPPDVITLSNDIDNWLEQYGEAANSPYTSESFGGYSYVKGSQYGDSGNNTTNWQSVFSSRLNKWRRIRGII